LSNVSELDPAATLEGTDSEVIARVLKGAKEDFRILVSRHQDTLYRMLLRQTGDSAVSHDLAQESFLRAYTKLGTFRGDSLFSTWLTRISINLANNYFASKEYRERRRKIAAEPGNSGPDVAHLEQRLLLLREFIAELKPKYREVISLCGLEKKSYEEVALILNIPIGTVRSRLHEARLQLRERFLTEARDL